jgi:hypothetical protein
VKPRTGAWELVGMLFLAWVAFASIPLALGEIGISWDTLNHHIYLGWTAENPRFEQDFLAALYQGYQFPYLYWPAYKLSASGFTGAQAGVVLATLHLVAVPPVWMIARICVPGRHGFDVFMRSMAVALAFTSGVVLSLFDSTSNDLLAAAPLVWAIAFGLAPWDEARGAWLTTGRAIVLSGLFAGVSVAFKLSNGPLAILLPVLWVCARGSGKERIARAAIGCIATVAGCALAYGYWGWQLWTHLGNPVYPFYDSLFVGLPAWLVAR